MTLVDRMKALVDGLPPILTPSPAEEKGLRPAREIVTALRAAGSVLDADRVLATEPVLDWPGILAEHRTSPLGRVALRALAGRADCSAEMRLALVSPFDVAVTRGIVPGSRGPAGAFPREVVLAALARIAEVRPGFFGEVTGTVPVDEMIAATTRFDLLVRALGRCRGGNERFWPALGRRVRPALGRSPARWLAAAAALPAHRGTVRGFLRKLHALEPATPDPGQVDLHLLGQAPDGVIAAVLDGWDDAALERVTGGHTYSCRAVDRMVLRGLRAGARPRYAFGWWRPRLDDDHERMTLWPAIGGAILEGDITLRAEREAVLRRRLVWSRPEDGGWVRRGQRQPTPYWTGGNAPANRDPAADLVAELRKCGSALQAEAVLCATLPDDAEPDWAELTAAHQAAVLPAGAVRALLDRPGFPVDLLDALTDHQLIDLFERHRGAARTVLIRLPWSRIEGPFDRVAPAIASGTLTPADILTLARPAGDVLAWIFRDHPHRAPDPDRAPRAAAQLNRTKLAREAVATELDHRLTAAPVDWTRITDRLPTFAGPVADLLS